MSQQDPASVELCDDIVIGLEDMLAFQDRCVFHINTMRANRIVDLQSILLAYREIFKPVGGRRMHTPRTRFGGDVISKHDRHVDVREGRLEHQPLELGASGRRYLGNTTKPESFSAVLG